MPNRVRFLVSVIFLLAAMLAIAVMANYLAARHHTRWDWTPDSYFTLSEKTQNVLRDLDRPVSIIVFLQPSLSFFEDVKQLLTQYEAASGKLTIEYVDYRRPARMQELVEKYQNQSGNLIIFECDGRTKFVAESDLVERDYSQAMYGGEGDVTGFKAEQAITAAIQEIADPVRPVLGLTTGHGEPDAAYLRELFTRENFQVVELNLLREARVPDTCAVLVSLGATGEFLPQELAAIDSYLAGGGKALLSLDLLLKRGGAIGRTGLETLVERRGVTVHNDLAIDPDLAISQFGTGSIAVLDYPPHEITRPLAGKFTGLLLARSFAAADTLPAGVTYTPLLRTSAGAWGEQELSDPQRALEQAVRTDRDRPGPLDLGFLLEQQGGFGIVAIGDAEFAFPLDLGQGMGIVIGPGNFELLVNAVNYLAQRKSLIAIPPKDPKIIKLDLTPQQISNFFWLTVVLIPLATLVSGIYVWIRRRV